MPFYDDLKTRIEEFILILKEDNPNANWKNLVTGLVILLMAAVFSIWYFNNPSDQKRLIDQLRRNPSLEVNEDFTTNGKNGNSILSSNNTQPEYVTVEKGEGLWHVAKRVCGDGEAYNHLADANGLNLHWSRLAVGQRLVVDCGE